MLTIGTFARLAGVSVWMLRHYDRLDLLTPDHVDEFSGYRYYGAGQLDRANQLVALKDLGFTLEQVGTLLADDLTRDQLAEMLRVKMADLNRQMSADQFRLRQVEAQLQLIERTNPMSIAPVFTESALPHLRLVQVSALVPSMGEIEDEIPAMFERVNAAVAKAGATRVGPGVAHYLSNDDGVTAAAAEQIGEAPVPEGLEDTVLSAIPKALTTQYVSDDIAGIQQAWQNLVIEVEQRGLTPSNAACREIYLETPYEDGGTRWVVDLQQPLA